MLAGSGTGGLTATACARYLNDLGTSVLTSEEIHSSLSVYPTPATDHIMVEFEQEVNAHITAALYSSDGRCVLMNELTGTSHGTHRYRIELPTLLAPGRYVLELSSAARTLHGAVIVDHASER